MATRNERNPGMKRILIVDDEAFIRDLFREVLEDEGWLVDTASTAEEALRLYAQHPYHLVMLDCIMPEVGGVMLHQRLSEQYGYGHRPELKQTPKLPPILFVTGDSGPWSTKEIIFREAVTGVLSKPVPIDDLVRVVSENLAVGR